MTDAYFEEPLLAHSFIAHNSLLRHARCDSTKSVAVPQPTLSTGPYGRDFISSLCCSPDGCLIATTSIDAVIRLWCPSSVVENFKKKDLQTRSMGSNRPQGENTPGRPLPLKVLYSPFTPTACNFVIPCTKGTSVPSGSANDSYSFIDPQRAEEKIIEAKYQLAVGTRNGEVYVYSLSTGTIQISLSTSEIANEFPHGDSVGQESKYSITALDCAPMNLHGCQQVVISACFSTGHILLMKYDQEESKASSLQWIHPNTVLGRELKVCHYHSVDLVLFAKEIDRLQNISLKLSYCDDVCLKDCKICAVVPDKLDDFSKSVWRKEMEMSVELHSVLTAVVSQLSENCDVIPCSGLQPANESISSTCHQISTVREICFDKTFYCKELLKNSSGVTATLSEQSEIQALEEEITRMKKKKDRWARYIEELNRRLKEKV